MARESGPMTATERQRAYRERVRERKAALLEREEAEISVAALNARMRSMAMEAFDQVGGVEYLKKVAAKNANTFLRFVGQFVTKDETINPANFTFVVQKITIEAAPVSGVICSPVIEHVAIENQIPVPPATELVEDVSDA